jgi:protein SCO1/2
MERRTLLTSLLATLGAPRGAVWAHAIEPAPVSRFELPLPRAVQPFSLRTHGGAPFSEKQLRGRWSFLFFGFTHCPDVCPTTLVELLQVRQAIAERRVELPSAILFVTIDPTRDTEPRLNEYVGRFTPGVTGLRGTDGATKRFADQFRVRYELAAGGNAAKGDYRFDHTASVSLIGPDGSLYAIYTLPLRSGAVADDVIRIHAKHRAALCPAVSGRGESATCTGRTA